MDSGTSSGIVRRNSLAGLAVALCASTAAAQQAEDRFWVQLAGYWPGIESTARADFLASGTPGTSVSFENDLGLADRKALPWFAAGARLGDRWRLEFEYFGLSRTGTRTISQSISWDDTVFPASATLDTRFDSDIFRLSAGWSFLRTPQAEAGLAVGAHVTDFNLSLATQTTVGGLQASASAESEDVLVPLPTIGLYGRYDFAKSWSLFGRIDYFSFNTGDYGGGLTNALAGVTYRFNDRFGASLGYRYIDYSLDVDKSDWRGSVDYRFSGPFLQLQLGF